MKRIIYALTLLFSLVFPLNFTITQYFYINLQTNLNNNPNL